MTINGDSRLATEIHRVKEEIGDEFKYPPYLTVSTEWMAVERQPGKVGGYNALNQEKGDSLLPVNFTSCPLINAIIIVMTLRCNMARVSEMGGKKRGLTKTTTP